jgi:hypothetical protein
MIKGLLTFLIACLALPAAALSQPGAAPDPAALDLARLLMSRDETLYNDADLNRFQTRVERELLAMDGACNPFVRECQAAAITVARQYAPAYRQAERARAELVTAFLLSDTLQPAEMVHIAAYLRSDEGRRFLEALAILRQDDRTRDRRRELERRLARTTPDVLGPARALFRQQTRNLPQPAPH